MSINFEFSEFKNSEYVPEIDQRFEQYVNRIGLGIRLNIGESWMWFAGYKFGVPIVADKVTESVKVAPDHLNQLCEQLKSEGFSISIMLRKENT